jgi:hypothetical protein
MSEPTQQPAKSPRQGNPQNLVRKKHPTHLKRGDKQPKTALSIPELEYCSWRAQGAYIADACRYAGLPIHQGYGIERRELVLKTIEEMKEKFKADVLQRTAAAATERTEVLNNLGQDLALFVHGEYRHRMSTMTTHEHRGDADVRNLLRDGMEAVGLVQPKGTVINASAQAAAMAGQPAVTALQVYESQWMIENKRKMSGQLEQKYLKSAPAK